MDMLRTAVVDITTLVAACHALKSCPADGMDAPPAKLHRQLWRDLQRGTVAYINVLARTRRSAVDDALLATCRLAAEQQMPQALAHQALLGQIMGAQTGCLDGLAAARQDLWRLAHLAIQLSAGMATLRAPGTPFSAKPAQGLARRLRRRFRKALIAYARSTLGSRRSKAKHVVKARAAALAAVGARGAAEVEWLVDLEARVEPAVWVMRLGVARPLRDLTLDWRRNEPTAI